MKRRLSFAVLTAAALSCAALPVGAEEAKAGLPQLDASLFPGQLVWLAVSFGLLYVLMAFVALPGIKRMQDRRMGQIAADLAAAQAANDSAKDAMARYEKTLADARAKAQATVSELAATMAKESAAEQAAQQQELGKKLLEAEARIASARDAAVKEVQDKAAELAKVIVEKVTGSSHAA